MKEAEMTSSLEKGVTNWQPYQLHLLAVRMAASTVPTGNFGETNQHLVLLLPQPSKLQ
jgi:hypothetical protein